MAWTADNQACVDRFEQGILALAKQTDVNPDVMILGLLQALAALMQQRLGEDRTRDRLVFYGRLIARLTDAIMPLPSGPPASRH